MQSHTRFLPQRNCFFFSSLFHEFLLFILQRIDGQALRLSSDGLTVLCTKVSRNSTLLIINKEVFGFWKVFFCCRIRLRHANYMDQMRLPRVNRFFLLLLATDDHANGIRDAAEEDYFSLNVFQTYH